MQTVQLVPSLLSLTEYRFGVQVLVESHVKCINFPVVLAHFDWYFLEVPPGFGGILWLHN